MSDFQIGESVQHKKFGTGIVLGIAGEIVEASFPGFTPKRIVAAFLRRPAKHEKTVSRRSQPTSLEAAVDRVIQADRIFFERFPHRCHRVRLASRAEIEQGRIISGRNLSLPPELRYFVAVKNIADGVRLRNFIVANEGMETDLPEIDAFAVNDAAATDKTRAIEAQLRRAVEKRK